MDDEIKELLFTIQQEENPSFIADDLSHFVIESLREEQISIYEAYLIHFEVIKFTRISYIQPSWSGKVRITACLALFNQLLLSQLFNEPASTKILKEWLIEAFNLNQEKRPHYIMDKLEAFINIENNLDLLEEMRDTRKHYDQLSDDDGPFHNEVFPYHFYKPEDMLLDAQLKKVYSEDKMISEEIEELIVGISLA